MQLDIDPDRANLAGVTNLDVAMSSVSGISGLPVATLREGQKQIPVVTRLRMDERAQLADLHNLYVYAAQSVQKVPSWKWRCCSRRWKRSVSAAWSIFAPSP